MFGLLANPIFRTGGLLSDWSDGALNMMIWNAIGAAVLIAYNLVLSVLHFYILDKTGMLRVPKQAELSGLDIVKHKEPAYGFGTAFDEVNVPDTTVKPTMVKPVNGINRNSTLKF